MYVDTFTKYHSLIPSPILITMSVGPSQLLSSRSLMHGRRMQDARIVTVTRRRYPGSLRNVPRVSAREPSNHTRNENSRHRTHLLEQCINNGDRVWTQPRHASVGGPCQWCIMTYDGMNWCIQTRTQCMIKRDNSIPMTNMG